MQYAKPLSLTCDGKKLLTIIIEIEKGEQELLEDVCIRQHNRKKVCEQDKVYNGPRGILLNEK